MHKYLKLALCIIAPLATGAVAGIVTSTNVSSWYQTIIKPSFNPPNYLFGPVWTILYLLMGVGLYLIVQAKPSPERTAAMQVFCLQWVLNFCWTFLFFKYHLLGFALFEIICMW
jgi:translocator protein